MIGERPARARTRRWGIWTGLAVSAVLHAALAIFLWTGRADVPLPPPPDGEAPDRVSEWEDALQVVEVPVPAPPSAAAETEAEVQQEEPEPGLPTAEPVPAGEPAGAEVPGAALSAAERLRPRVGDPRLWARAPIDTLAPGLRGRYDRAEAALRRLLKTYLDSLELSEEQEKRARAWVFGEGDEKWGISPQGLHLGDVTIPLPFGQMLSRGGEARREAEQVLRTWRMIQFQAGRIEAEEVREERLEAIRERTRERLRERSGGAADSAAGDTAGA